jgi:hypothetical protein
VIGLPEADRKLLLITVPSPGDLVAETLSQVVVHSNGASARMLTLGRALSSLSNFPGRSVMKMKYQTDLLHGI